MMVTELVRPSCIKEDNMEIPLIPPGFESFANLNVKKIEDRETISNCSASTSASVSHPKQMQTQVESNNTKTKRNLRRRSGLSYCRFDDCSGDEFDSDQNLVRSSCLPKGVIRGCKDCINCQTVTTKWRPEDARRPDLENAPIFYPNEEEFQDTLAYIASIRPTAEKYGICRIVPPPSWKPPCPLTEKNMWEKSKFQTRVQKVDKLQNRNSVKKMLMAYNNKKKRRRCSKNMVNKATGKGPALGSCGLGTSETEYFGFEPGPEFTLQDFQKYANDFKGQYFRKDGNMTDLGNVVATNQCHWVPSVENIEGEYWRMVEKPTEELEVLYGADLETGVFGSGFPTHFNQGCTNLNEKYVKSGWNLNNFPRLSGSVLSYESSDISGVLVPWLYIGMCFSSFCWHVEDHYLYSLNYMHWGAPKMWYGVPGEEAVKLEAAMRKHLPDLFEEQPDLLHKLVTQLSPTILKREGVPVYRCVQNPGEFVLTFPRAYHAGFNCGFNCAEAVNVAPVDWLPHGYNAIELYRKQGRKTSVSHDKLLLGAAREAVKAHWEINLQKKHIPDNLKWESVCGSDGILSKALKARIEMELTRRESLCISSHAVKMSSNFDATDERECCVCLFDLHLSAVGCHCSPERYTCLYHANHLCTCSWNAKFYLFRYDVNELNILVDAVEGKLSAVYRWARLDLGLALSSQPSKGIQGTKVTSDVSHKSEGKLVTETSSKSPVSSLKVIIKKEHIDKVPNTRESRGRPSSPNEESPIDVVLALEAVNFPKPVLKVKLGKCNPTIKKETPDLDLVPQASQQVGSSIDKKLEVKKTSFSLDDNIILLSDDESETSDLPISEGEKQASAVIGEQCEELRALDDTMSVSKSMEDYKGNSLSFMSRTTTGATSAVGPVKCEMLTESNPVDPFSYRGSTFMDIDKGAQNLSNTTATGDCNIANNESGSQPQRPCDDKVLRVENRHNIRLNNNLISSNDLHSMSSPNTQKNVDQYFRQKGPRIAKVVRRINCNVEPLEYGVVHSGKFWCNSQAIFPMGFKSRAKYINLLDPTSMCYYVSEVLDGGLDRPLFMVTLEHCSSEVFAHVSASKCWDMVRERVNQEITKQHKLGKPKLHPLQPPKSLDGLEMFGFSSPAIVQVIQAMDKNQVCTEYWKSRPLMQMSQHPSSEHNAAKSFMKNDILNEQKPNQSNSMSAKVDLVFGNLLNKANPEELQALFSILGNNKSTTDEGLAAKLLNQEIHQRQR